MSGSEVGITAAEKQYVMGVDIGGTKILYAIADAEGQIVHTRKEQTTDDFHVIAEQTAACAAEAGLRMEKIAAVGFGIPGITDTRDGVVIEAPAFGWNRFPFKEQIAVHVRKPVFINNDVNCAALGEKWIGTAKNCADFVFIAIGTGVGSAIVANGALVQGSGYMAGEIGYFVTGEESGDTPVNRFGQFGTFEKKTSGLALSGHGMTSRQLFERYLQGDSGAAVIIDRFVSDLAAGIANVVSLLNPGMVVIGGGVSGSMQAVLDQLRAKVARLTPVPAEIVLSSLGEQAGAVGAAAYALEQAELLKRTPRR
ncbi:ROK family protein [Paenibacillus thalictri]|uniref:ROK family protein n=1 Tax=Paenibacillus thalictri TaxID=2527873 RepID=A0A4Q9DNB7_9BACL|nr:ROK family protein [Paenibacillus thalictri]TBL75277.1 ROK family protein [Paenibacillus thalictri]